MGKHRQNPNYRYIITKPGWSKETHWKDGSFKSFTNFQFAKTFKQAKKIAIRMGVGSEVEQHILVKGRWIVSKV